MRVLPLAALALALLSPVAIAAAETGQPAPAFAAAPLAAGAPIRLADYAGKVVYLDFWASWCGPCVQEGDVLASASSSHPDVEFVGADNRDTTSGFQAFEQRHPHVYPAGPIVSGSYQSYGVAGLPATFFIDARGVVAASFSGPLDASTLQHYMALIAT